MSWYFGDISNAELRDVCISLKATIEQRGEAIDELRHRYIKESAGEIAQLILEIELEE